MREKRTRADPSRSRKKSRDQDNAVDAYIADYVPSQQVAADLKANIEERIDEGPKKLLLVLDLDNTLVHSKDARYVKPNEKAYIESLIASGTVPELHYLPAEEVFTKLRPYVREFLQIVSKRFELMVYTMGDRLYAQAMAKLLDPTGTYFKGRVISRDDNKYGRDQKSLECCSWDHAAALILDDTMKIWKDDLKNVIVMPKYLFFDTKKSDYGDVPVLREKGGGLDKTLEALLAIHKEYTERDRPECSTSGATWTRPDVRDIAKGYRRNILQGCKLVFHSPKSAQWEEALALGAECSSEAKDKTATHIVTAAASSSSRWAEKHGKFAVHPTWIAACADALWRVPEDRYPPNVY